MDLAGQGTLGIEPGTSCVRGPVFTNWAMHATSLWSSSCSLSCPPHCPTWQVLWARLPYCSRKPLTTEGNSLLQRGNYYRKGTFTIIGRIMGKSYDKGFLYVVRSLTIRGNPLLCSKRFPYTCCLEISRRGFPSIVMDFLLW